MKAFNISFSDKVPETNLLVAPVCTDGQVSDLLDKIDKAIHGGIRLNIARERFTGAEGQTLVITTNGMHPIPKVMLIGLGERKTLSPLIMQQAGGHAAALIKEESIALDGTLFEPGDLLLGLLLRRWHYKRHCTERPSHMTEICVISDKSEACKKRTALYEGVALARELTVEPANLLYPDAFAKRCLELRKLGVEVEILDEMQLKQIGAEALLNVGKGSVHPPRMVVMQWKGGKPEDPPIALAGKGVCYDSGGINIKTSMLLEMKWDKAGAGTVTGLMHALAKQKAPVNVVGVIGLAENMPDGAALRPGDIIRTMAGVTVEVVDTDYEGRLVLADCLWYAQENFNPKAIIDLGTLTPETIATLAGEYAGLYTNDALLARELVQAGESSGEKVWQLPMGAAFAKQIISHYADIKNMGEPEFGECGAAAEFLKCFIKPDMPWAHLDIAGVAWTNEDGVLNGKGVTGFGVRLLHDWILK